MLHIQSLKGGRAENQDFYGTAQTQYGELIVVCDGMGGHNGGRHAAEVAVETIIEIVSKNNDKNPITVLQTAIEQASQAIWNESQVNRNLKGMGTTIVALLITPEKVISCHVGDSRIYQVRNGKILFRTYDHSHVFEMVKAGLINEEQARLSEKSNIITRALGIRPTVEIEITDNLSYQKGDRFLLCTDGICGMIPESELVKMINEKGNVETVVSNLVEKIDAIGKAHGGKHDNLTAALIEIETNSTLQNTEVQQSGSSKKRPTIRGKRLIYLLLILLLGSLALNVYFVMQKKMEEKTIENIEIKKNVIKQIQKVTPQTADTTTTILNKK
jgi:serine/threonine protein phosphatase PrpC